LCSFRLEKKVDPFLKRNDSTIASNQVQLSFPYFTTYDFYQNVWVNPFIMCNVTADCFLRSMALSSPPSESSSSSASSPSTLKYREVQVFPNFFAAFVSLMRLYLYFFSFYFPPLYKVLRKSLPKPGKGPSKELMDAGFLRLTTIGKGNKGAMVESMIYFPTDAYYRDTVSDCYNCFSLLIILYISMLFVGKNVS
jgi:short subunit dehydrogenase-like uncharacterized protein